MKEYKRETISTIVSQINKNILLPDIQRPFVWDEGQIYKLFDSLMRGYPISTFLFWELTKDKLQAIETQEKLKIKMYKFVDSNAKESEEEINRDRDSYNLVLDGQQRLTSLFIALKGSWKKKIRKNIITHELYFDTLSGNTEDEDGILYEFQFLDKSNGELHIEVETIDEDTNFKVWVNVKKIFENDLGQAKIRREFVDSIVSKDSRLINYKDKISDNLDAFDEILKEHGIINYFPENETNYEKVLDIFVRTNAGGTKLGYSDLLFSKIKLSWTDARDEFKELITSINKNNFEFDADFILKTCLTIFANKNDDIRYRVTNLNGQLISNIENNWASIVSATKLTVSLLDDFIIKDKKQLPSYNAIIPIIYWHYKAKHKEYKTDNPADMADKTSIRVWLTKSLLSGVFGGQSDTVLYKCKEAIDSALVNNFPAIDIQNKIATLKSRSMDINNDKFDQYFYRSKESYLFLAICYKMAINFTPIMDGNLPQQDHIFSKNELKAANISEEKINNIYNIRFVTASDNKSKSCIPFADWVSLLGSNKGSVFQQHCIPTGTWSATNYDKFLESRKVEMLGKFNY